MEGKDKMENGRKEKIGIKKMKKKKKKKNETEEDGGRKENFFWAERSDGETETKKTGMYEK